MKRSKYLAVMTIASIVLTIWIAEPTAAKYIEVSASNDHLLNKYEQSDRKFKRLEIGDKIVYFHQRAINNAVVENDFIIYHFDRNTEELLDKKVHWRSDLPEESPHLLAPEGAPFLITKENAESMVEGEVQFSRLIVISPESEVFPVESAPGNPCWVVRSIADGDPVVTIIDAVTGEFLGYGVPPPQFTGFSLSGPWYSDPCTGAWTGWYLNAADWFVEMGYPAEAIEWPTEDEIRGHIESTETAVFYELAHGGSTWFWGGCLDGDWFESITSTEISDWITDYTKIPFSFLGSCGAMCSTGPGTLSYELRKGSTTDTATVGYCHMDASYCTACWGASILWQNVLFLSLSQGFTVQEAFDAAMADYPVCYPAEGPCVRFAGDANLELVPTIRRVSLVDVFVDIEPGHCPNPLNLKGKGLFQVAIAGTQYYNVQEIDIASVEVDGVKPIHSSQADTTAPFIGEVCQCDESGPDGFDDLTLKFRAQDIVAALGDVKDGDEVVLTLTGNTMNGTPIEGTDCIVISNKGKKKRH